MADMLRSQHMAARLQQQQLLQQEFLNGQQMGNMGGNGQQHTPNHPFLDSGSNQSPGFPAGVPNAAMQMNRSAMLQAFQANGNPAHARQLELMLQSQPGQQINMAQRLDHQRAAQQLHSMGQSPGGELFASGVDRRPSPGHPNVQGPNPTGGGLNPQQQQPPQQRKFSVGELNDRIAQVRGFIQSQERQLGQLGAQRGMPPDAQLLNRMRAISDEIKAKKEYLGKLMAAMNNFMAQASAQQQTNASGQASWATPQMQNSQLQNTTQGGQNNVPQGHGSPLNRSQAQIQQLNRLGPTGPASAVPRPASGQRIHQSHPSGQLAPPGAGPSFANQLSPNINFPFPMNHGSNAGSPPAAGAIGMQSSPSGSMQLPPPLEKSKFDSAYKSFCLSKGVKHDPRMLTFEGRDIDLSMLHTHVMQEGGHMKVNAQDLWSVIGAKMGFVQFPGTDTEPAKAGPAFAQRLAQVYREYLVGFDSVYITSVMESKKKQMEAIQQLQAQQQRQGPTTVVGNGNGGPLAQAQTMRGTLNGNQMQMVIGYANSSAEELRRQGVQEKIIQFVEVNRSNLQRMSLEQGMFRTPFQNPPLRPPEQHGPPGAAGPPFQNGSPHPGAASMNGQHPNFIQQGQNGMAPMQGNNFMNPRAQQHPPNGSLGQQKIIEHLDRIKSDIRVQYQRNCGNVDIPVEHRAEFNSIFGQLYNTAQEIDKQLPVFYYLMRSDDGIRKLISIIVSVTHQRALLASNPNSPRYIVRLETLKAMLEQVTIANHRMNVHLRRQMDSSQQQQQHLSHPAGNVPPNNHTMPDVARPPLLPQQQQMPPQSIPNRPPVLRHPPVSNKPSASTPGAAVSTPTPPFYSASTPVASAPTPTQTASSPSAPKSPKVKAKPKITKLRSHTNKQRTVSTPAPSAAEQPPTPLTNNGKRSREDDTPNMFGASPGASGSTVANEPSPPKRPKTEAEWGGPASEAVIKKEEVVENIKTEEDASAFLEQMTELIKMAGEGQEALSTDISETLDQILKGYGSVVDGPDTLLGFPSFGSLGESSSQGSSTKPHPDEFVEFFDFSSFTGTDEENDADSKAPTPELSSTGPSPDSGSEADAAHHVLLSIEPKTGDMEDLRLGTWKDIDGGESSYFHSADGWKWDSPMPSLEQPWAIFNS
ncbi:hypothetical protein C0991_001374 [Blastosporella zonata]|nr:hypothetical protein C0991_001374 [Blastosporella zonata]